MDTFSDFSDAFVDFGPRCDQSKLRHFIVSKLCNNSVLNILSIGPGQCQLECELINEHSKRIHNLYIVDNDDTLLQEGVEHVKEKTAECKADVHVHSFCQGIQDYEHAGEKLDLIFMLHSLYYFLDKKDAVLKKIIPWLSPDGLLVVAVDGSPMMKTLAAMRDTADGVETFIPQADIERWLCSGGLNVQPHRVDYKFDLTRSQETGYKWAEVMLHGVVREDQLPTIATVVNEHRASDGDYAANHNVLVIGSLKPFGPRD